MGEASCCNMRVILALALLAASARALPTPDDVVPEDALVEHDDEQCESMRHHIEDQKECDKCKVAKGTEGYPKNCMTYGSCIEEAKPVIPCAVENAVAQCQAQGCKAAKDPKECIMPKNGGDPSDDCQGCLGCMGGILKDPATGNLVGDWKATQTNLQKAMAGAGQHEELVEARWDAHECFEACMRATPAADPVAD